MNVAGFTAEITKTEVLRHSIDVTRYKLSIQALFSCQQMFIKMRLEVLFCS